MDQRRHRGGAFHRVRQPGVQAKLRRLAHRADEQEQAQGGQDVDVITGKEKALARHGGGGDKHRVEIQCAEHRPDAEDAQREAEIAHPVDDERLDGGGIGGRTRVPEADHEIGRQAHPFPAEEHLQDVVGRHQHQHGEGEQRQVREEARPAGIFVHVADGVEVHQARHAGHHHQHHGRDGVDPHRPVHRETRRMDPGQDGNDVIVALQRHVIEGHRRQGGGSEQAARGHQLAGAGADDAAEQPRDGGTENGQEDDQGIHLSPSSD